MLIRTAIWPVAALAAMLVPAPGTAFDGIPLDRPLEAVLVGVVVPLLSVLHARFFHHSWAKGLVAALVASKLTTILLLTLNGFCTEFRTAGPVRGPVGTIEIEELSGLMRSWDVRAHWGSGEASCSAITRRDYGRLDEFPAWFVNVLDNTVPPHHELTLVMRGTVTVGVKGTLSFDTVPAAGEALIVDGHAHPRTDGRLETTLESGSHHVELRTTLSAGQWRAVPLWNGQSLWSSALVTVDAPGPLDRLLWRLLPTATTMLFAALIVWWIIATIMTAPIDPVSSGLVLTVSVAAGLLAETPAARVAPLVIGLVTLSRAATHDALWRTALWLIGIPWLTFVVTMTLPRVGELTRYSAGDDWLTYQISAYRIYLQGYWLEAGEKLFYYQPLYRWIAGALHVVFGDSSAGETLWDGACLLVGALMAFLLCRKWVGGRGALVAAGLTLAVFTLTPIWYLIGRGLAEISAGGFAWTAVIILQSRARRTGWVVLASVFAVLAFYARLNHILFALALVVFLLPPDLPASALRHMRRVGALIPLRQSVMFLAGLAVGVALLSLRAWLYTGEISPFAGTSLGLNHTGLTLGTLLSADVWRNVFHSLFAQMIVNEVFDPRGVLVYAGCLAAVLAILQVPGFRRLPLALAVAVIGALAGALVAHAHGYPGRFSVHLVPLATAMAVVTAWTLVRGSEVGPLHQPDAP
jgi:hypothetical protein